MSCEGQKFTPQNEASFSTVLKNALGTLYHKCNAKTETVFWGTNKNLLYIQTKTSVLARNFSTLKRTNVPSFAFHKPLDLCECQQYHPHACHSIHSEGLVTVHEWNLKMSRWLWCSSPLKSQSTEEKHWNRSMFRLGKYQLGHGATTQSVGQKSFCPDSLC